MPKWYAVTYRAPAEMTVAVLADTPDEARMRAEDALFAEDPIEDIHWVPNQPYTMKVKLAPTDFEPPDASS